MQCVDYSKPQSQLAGGQALPAMDAVAVPDSDCAKAYSVDQGGWSGVMSVCKQLFSSVDYTLHSASSLVCHLNPLLGASVCHGHNVILDPAAALVIETWVLQLKCTLDWS